jgi:fatty-acid desaturase
MRYPTVSDPDRQALAFPNYARLNSLATVFAPTIGTLIAVVLACVYRLPTHAVVGLFTIAYATGFGVTVGFHRLLAPRV